MVGTFHSKSRLRLDELERFARSVTADLREPEPPEPEDILVGNYESPPTWFHDAQRQFWASDKPVIAICAGWQSGKTVALGPWLLREIQRRGPGDYGAFSSTYRLLSRKFLPELKNCLRALTDFRVSDQQFIFTENGSRRMWGSAWDGTPTVVQLGHAENPDSLESATLKAVAWDEPGQRLVPEQSFLTVESRLMVNRGRMALASRPYEPGWYERLVKKGEKDPGGRIEVVSFPSWANPVNPPWGDPWWEEKLSTWPKWRFDMYYGGRFTKPAGLIYDCFDYEANTCDDFPIPKEWTCYPCMDFGPVNAAGLAIAEDPHSKTLFLVGEYHSGTKRTSAENALEMRRISPRPFSVGCGGNKTTEQGWREAMAANGIFLDEPPDKNPEVQIQCVYEQLATGRLKVFRRACSLTISDIEGFSRELDENGEVTDEIAGHEPHRLAALRYGITKLRPPSAPADTVATFVPAQAETIRQPQTRSWDLTGRAGR